MHNNREKIFGVIRDTAPRGLPETVEPIVRPKVLMHPLAFNTPILMQGESPECGGYSLAWLISFLKLLGTPLSGSFDYAYEKTIDGIPNVDGTIISAVGLAGYRVGSCPITDFHDDGVNSSSAPHTLWANATSQAITDASKNVLGTPVRITDHSINGIHDAIARYMCVILEVQVGNEWWTAKDGITESWDETDILPIRPPEKVVDSHYVAVWGYDETKDMTWFANSWSNKWGHNGFGYFNSNYAPFIVDAIAWNPPINPAPVLPSQPTVTQVTNWLDKLKVWLMELYNTLQGRSN